MSKTCRQKTILIALMSASGMTPAFASTKLTADSTAPIVTSSAGDVTIAEDVTLKPTGANPITVDSNNSVTVEDGAAIKTDAADGRSAILVNAGTNATILNDGAISVLEDYLPADKDSNGKPDGVDFR